MENEGRKLLNGWKQIAAYLDRGVRTVQRWEVELGLPVRRPHGKFKSTVMALPAELDAWVARTPQHLNGNGTRAAGTMPSEEIQDRPGTLRVLVVEDSVRDVSTCLGVLRKIGTAEVDVVSNVSAALLRLEEIMAGKLDAPDLIILDLAFPRDSGFEVIRFWRGRPALANIPLVVWTSVAHSQQRLCIQLGARDVVSKLGGPAELERVLVSAGLSASSRVA